MKKWLIPIGIGLSIFLFFFLYLSTRGESSTNVNRIPDKFVSYFLSTAKTALRSGIIGSSEASCKNGLLMRAKGECFCNLGWRGSDCSIQDKSILLTSKAGQNSMLLVVDYFSPSDVDNANAIYHTALATFLKKNGYDVSVLVLNPPSNRFTFESIIKLFAAQGLKVLTLPEMGKIKFGVRPPVQTSYRLFRFLSQNKEKYGTVIIASANGAAYYPLLAQRQGLACLPPNIYIYVEEPGPILIQSLTRPNYTVVEPEILRLDFMQQKAFEMSSVVLFPNKIILDLVQEGSGWQIKPLSISLIVPPLTLPVRTLPDGTDNHKNSPEENEEGLLERADEMIASRQTLVREFVFVGKLGTAGGLHIFLSAIDSLLSRDAKSHKKLLKGVPIKLTFFGVNDVIDSEGDLTGENYIEAKAYNWGNRVKWAIAGGDKSLKRLIRYLGEAGKGRVAVVPALIESTCFFLHQALRTGIPVIASNLKSAQELVHLQDRRDVLFNVNDSSSLAKRLADIWVQGVVVGRPAAPLKSLQNQWKQVLAELNARSLPECPASMYDAKRVQNPDGSPLISVILVHHNRLSLLKQAIASLESQTFKDFEVILVDDGSTDPEALKFLDSIIFSWWQERGWKVLREGNRYLGAARNTGAKHSSGKYLLFMDDDDIAKPDQLEVMLRVAEVSGADIVTTGHDTFVGNKIPGGSSNVARYVPLGGSPDVGIWENCFGDSNFLVHRRFFIDSKGFTEEFGVGFEDYEYLARAVLRDNHLEPIAEPMHWYRQHAKSMSRDTDLRANRMRFLRPYHEMHQFLSNLTRANLMQAQWQFFDKDLKRGMFAEETCGCNATTCDTTTTTSLAPSVTTLTTTGSTVSTTSTTSTGSATRAITTFSSFTFLNSTSSESSTTTSALTTSTSTTISPLTLTSLFTTACPCRVLNKKRTTSKSTTTKISKPTCFTTMTVTPTLTRTAKPCTLLRTVIVDCEGGNCVDMNVLNNLGGVSSTTYFIDQPPPKSPLALAADFLPKGNEIVVRFDSPVNIPIGKVHVCSDWLETMPHGIPNAAFLGKDCNAMFVSPVEMRVRLNSQFLANTLSKSKVASPNQLLIFKRGVLGNTGSMNRAFVSGSIEIAGPEDAEQPIVIVRAPSLISKEDNLKVDLVLELWLRWKTFR